MKHFFLLTTLLFFSCLSFAQTDGSRGLKLVKPPVDNPTNQVRKAIVIGMSNYIHAKKLPNTLNDADSMSVAFQKLGFDVTLLKDRNLQDLETDLADWYDKIKGNDMAVFYFAGHGMEVGGENYLIPVDFIDNGLDTMKIKARMVYLQYHTLPVTQVLNYLEGGEVGAKMLILDACRENPFTSANRGSENQGLAGVSKTGTFIAYAAAKGKTAGDGGIFGNGVFTHFLKQEIVKPGVSWDNIFGTVASEVKSYTDQGQNPFRNTDLGIIYFIPPGDNPAPNPTPENPDDPTILLRKANVLSKNKHYPEAFDLYQKAANQGNAAAQNNLGLCYENAYGVFKDINQAIVWYKKAADQGNLNAQTALDRLQNNLSPVPAPTSIVDVAELVRQADTLYNNKQYDKAVSLYKQAAGQDNAEAQRRLGFCYENGLGITKDFTQAKLWYKKAADQGDFEAQRALQSLQNNSLASQDQDVTFKATSEKVVVVNQQFRVNYTLSTPGITPSYERNNLHLGDTNNFELLYGPVVSQQGSSTSIVNGKTVSTSTIVFTCVLMAKSEGTFTIPPATIVVGNSIYNSNELTVKVLPSDQAANAGDSVPQDGQSSTPSDSISSNDVFVRAIVSKNSVYENEGFLVTFKLYSLVNITGFEGVKFPGYEGFIAKEIDLPNSIQLDLESYNGRNYKTAIMKQTILFPQRSGQIIIGSGKFDIVAQIRSHSQQKAKSFFDDFFDSYSEVKKTLTSAPAIIDVYPLPTAGKPASFSGAAGDYIMTSSINTTRLKTNDTLTVKVIISGNGNLKMSNLKPIKIPDIVFPDNFDKMEPIVTNNTITSVSGVDGTETIEYKAIPRSAGNFTIPKAEFSYFDLKSKTYKILTTDEYRLIVTQGLAGAINQTATNKEDSRFFGKDIMICLDISSSMLAQDLKPDRLEAAKENLASFIKGCPNDNIGLVVFSKGSYIQCPLTHDHAVLIDTLKNVKCGKIEDGTAIGDGLETAAGQLKVGKSKSKIIILLTDGVNNQGEISPLDAAEISKTYGIKVHTIAIGTTGEVPYPVQTDSGVVVKPMKVEIDENILTQIAQLTGGQFFKATNNNALKGVFREIKQR